MTLLEDVTPEEQKVIDELRRRNYDECTPKMQEDPTLFYRFAKARNFNLKQSEAMLRKNIAFRKEHGVDSILTHYKPPEVLAKYVPSSFLGYDKEGSVVRYIDVACADSKGVIRSAKKSDLIKFNLYLIEKDVSASEKQSQKLGKLLTNMVYIYNFDNLTFAKATHKESVEMIMMGIKIYQDNYPERIKAIYVLNASFYFTVLFSAVKHVVAAAVIEKVNLFGKNGWKEVLLEVIDSEMLPAFLGGKRTDPDGNRLCKSFINHGDIVPESYYLSKSKKVLYLEPGVQKLYVNPFSSSSLTFDIEEPDSLLEWEFETKSRDIGFGVFLKLRNEEKLNELVPKQRIDTGIEPETGVYKCEKPGTYLIVFDNSYSWIYPKEIFYRVKIVPPSKEEIN